MATLATFGGPRPPAIIALICALWLSCGSALGLEVPPLRGHVNDTADLLNAQQEQALEQWLAEYERGSGHQFALLTVPSLEDDPLEDFSIRVADAWKLGSEQQDDGLLLLIVPQDRKMRVEVGYGLEGAIPDALAGRVIRDVLAPQFRKLQYEQGIRGAFEVFMKAAGGEPVALPEPSSGEADSPGGGISFAIMIALMLLFMFGGGRRGGLFWLGAMAASSRGGGYRGGGGGGFSGGGGGFGGGGASGSW